MSGPQGTKVSDVSQPGWSGQSGFQGNSGWGQQAPTQQHGWSQQGWPQGGWQGQGGRQGTPQGMPSPQRRSPARFVFGALLALTVIAFGVLIVVSLTGGGEKYQNDDYSVPPPDLNPPAIPQPKSEAEAKQWTDDNAFYSQTVPQPVRCENTKLEHADTATQADLQKHLDGLTACLMRVWDTPVTKAGFTLVRPSVTIYAGSIETGCGTLDYVNAVYCGADQQVYYSKDLFKLLPEVQRKDSTVVDFVIAHEFGHALQGRTGILVARIIQQQQAGSDSQKLELNRRLEMQADCFSGMYMRATARSMGLDEDDVTTIRQSLKAVGDRPNKEGDHGQSENREFWGLTGFATDQVGKCNTYKAPSHEVR